MLEILLSSVLVGVILAPLGCFVLWKKYVYLSDGLAHASMLAAIISTIAGVPLWCIAIVNTIFFTLIVFKARNIAGNSASIGLASSLMISLGVILSAIFPNKFNLDQLLFGDILAVDFTDMLKLFIMSLISIYLLIFTYKDLLLTIISKDIAHSRGVNTKTLEFIFLSILSFAIIVTIKIVGTLLVTSIVLVPPMIARTFAKTPHAMIIISVLAAQIMNFCGITLSILMDYPFAPSVVICGVIIYVFALIRQIFLSKMPKCKGQ